ncbi:MAG: hypothetical protein JXN64_14190 [Spirochaetes bacterium]|nr:hypothetical protein [Spirochaetota bacterium]
MVKKISIFLFIITLSTQTLAVTLQSLLDNGPLLSINKTSDGVFESVMSMTVIHAPFDLVWNTIIDINNYKNYMNRVLKSKIINEDENGLSITAEFEIDAPFFNMDYTLKHILDKNGKKIDVIQVKGDLEGSKWKWEFESQDEKTLVFYSGKTINFSSFLQKFEDKSKTISMGINIASVLETLNNIKRQSEKIFTEEKLRNNQ